MNLVFICDWPREHFSFQFVARFIWKYLCTKINKKSTKTQLYAYFEPFLAKRAYICRPRVDVQKLTKNREKHGISLVLLTFCSFERTLAGLWIQIHMHIHTPCEGSSILLFPFYYFQPNWKLTKINKKLEKGHFFPGFAQFMAIWAYICGWSHGYATWATTWMFNLGSIWS